MNTPYRISKKSNKNKRKSTNKRLNIFENKNFLLELWHLIFFSSISIFLIFTYLNQAWKPISTEQIEIRGLSGITKDEIKKASSIFFPRNLLELNPKEIEAYLIKKLPIKVISVNRKFFPPGIHVNLIEREPIAFARRTFLNKVENGMIDIDGYWIPMQFANESKKNKIDIFIEEWNPNAKKKLFKS